MMRRFGLRCVALAVIFFSGFTQTPPALFAADGCGYDCDEFDFYSCVETCEFDCMELLEMEDPDCARVCGVEGEYCRTQGWCVEMGGREQACNFHGVD